MLSKNFKWKQMICKTILNWESKFQKYNLIDFYNNYLSADKFPFLATHSKKINDFIQYYLFMFVPIVQL